MTFQSDIVHLCTEVAATFEGWEFEQSSSVFKNNTLGHTDLIVCPGITYAAVPSCSVHPFAKVYNKRTVQLFKRFVGRERWTSGIRFALECPYYCGARAVRHIFPEAVSLIDARGIPQSWPDCFIVLSQAKNYFTEVLEDGIRFLNAHYDFTNEDNLLRNLPTSYRWMARAINNMGTPGSFYEEDDGLMLCMAAVALGQFDFVEHYARDDFITTYPKRPELKNLIAALPELKRVFAERGKVI